MSRFPFFRGASQRSVEEPGTDPAHLETAAESAGHLKTASRLRAFALVGALSVVRFRNAIKETRDVGFTFLVMAVGMTTGTRFYVLAIAATIAICLVLIVMSKFNWFKLDVQRQVVKVQVPPEQAYTARVEDVMIEFCSEHELVSTESVRTGALNELYYTAQLKKGRRSGDLVAALNEVNSGQRVTVLTGYDQTDL